MGASEPDGSALVTRTRLERRATASRMRSPALTAAAVHFCSWLPSGNRSSMSWSEPITIESGLLISCAAAPTVRWAARSSAASRRADSAWSRGRASVRSAMMKRRPR